MDNNNLISWTAFTLFVLAVAAAFLTVFAPGLNQLGWLMSEMALWVMGLLALLSVVLGFVAFKTPQGKIASIGGIVFLLAVLYITPLARGDIP